MTCFIREKVIHCGDEFIAPEIYQYSGRRQEAVRKKRRKKYRVSEPKQKDLNDKRAKRYFVQLANGSFGAGDQVAHLSYSPAHLPDTYEAAEDILTLFIRRLSYARKRAGLSPLKYLAVTQYGRAKNGTHRIHHHVIINGGLDRDDVEKMWWASKTRNPKKAAGNPNMVKPDPDKNEWFEFYGWANVDRLKPNRKGIAQMAGYIVKDSAGKRHWRQSQNLTKPWYKTPNDTRYTRRQLEKVAKLPTDCEDYRKFWESKYKGYELIESEKQYNDQTGWSFYLMMRKRI